MTNIPHQSSGPAPRIGALMTSRVLRGDEGPVWPIPLLRPATPEEMITGVRLIHEAAHVVVAQALGYQPTYTSVMSPDSKTMFDERQGAVPTIRDLAVVTWAGWPAIWRYWREIGQPSETVTNNLLVFARELAPEWRQAREMLRNALPDKWLPVWRAARDEAGQHVHEHWDPILRMAMDIQAAGGAISFTDPGEQHAPIR